MSFVFKHVTDFSFVFKTQQLDYSSCHFMQHVYLLLRIFYFFLIFIFFPFLQPLWAVIPECWLCSWYIFDKWWLSFGPRWSTATESESLLKLCFEWWGPSHMPDCNKFMVRRNVSWGDLPADECEPRCWIWSSIPCSYTSVDETETKQA